MSNPQLYSMLYCTIDGKLLTEAASIQLTRTSGANPVFTLHKKFAGVTPGASMCTIQVENAIPAAGLEYDPGEAIAKNKIVEIGIVGPGGKSAVSQGFIASDSYSVGVNAEAKMSFSYSGSFPFFE
jgi:hypothetical protein